MKRIYLLFLIPFQVAGLFGQGSFGDYCHNGNFSDSLDLVQLSGLVFLESNDIHPLYFMDTDNDGVADYQLSFGPYWYEPENGNSRPSDGDEVSIVGFVRDHHTPPIVMVNELNGLAWRSFNPNGQTHWHDYMHWVADLERIKLTGTALVDTSYYYPQYYIDVNQDDEPDHYLHFGPYWYEPESGAKRPDHGDEISVLGGMSNGFMGLNSIMVFELNGLFWRDSTGPHPWTGSWVHRDWSDSTLVFCQSDSASFIGFAAGCFGTRSGGHGGHMMFPDSIFCQFEEIHPDYTPGDFDSTMVACFYLDLMDQEGSGMNGSMGYGHGMRRLQSNPQIVLHYNTFRLEQKQLVDEVVLLKGFDPVTKSWISISNITVDQSRDLVFLNQQTVYSYYAIFTPKSTSTGWQPLELNTNEEELTVFPNPAVNEIFLRFDSQVKSPVQVKLYDTNGRLISLLFSGLPLNSGEVSINLAEQKADIPSGNYFIEVLAGDKKWVKQLSRL